MHTPSVPPTLAPLLPRQRGHAPRWGRRPALALLAVLASARAPSAQDLEPRRWSHMPVGTNIAGLTYVYTDGQLSLDPVLEIQDGEVESHTLVASFSHSFDFFSKTGRLDVLVPYQNTTWEGSLSGTPASREREGLSDPWVRLSINLAGAPALEGPAYLQYRAAHPVHTIVGAALWVMLPLGDYQDDKLLNLGQNRSPSARRRGSCTRADHGRTS